MQISIVAVSQSQTKRSSSYTKRAIGLKLECRLALFGRAYQMYII